MENCSIFHPNSKKSKSSRDSPFSEDPASRRTTGKGIRTSSAESPDRNKIFKKKTHKNSHMKTNYTRLLINSALAFVSALAIFPSCTKEPVYPGQQEEDFIEMTITVGQDTKTINDGNSTLWTDGDALSVIHSAASGNVFWPSYFYWFGNYSFTGKVNKLSASNDWYAVYPYDEEHVSADDIVLSTFCVGFCDSDADAVLSNIRRLWHVEGHHAVGEFSAFLEHTILIPIGVGKSADAAIGIGHGQGNRQNAPLSH